MPLVTGLYRYPVKGLSPQAESAVRVESGKPFPFDRVFALARPGVAVDPAAPKWAKKGLFVMLMLDEGLARVRTHLDEATHRLTVVEGNRIVLSADLNEGEGRARVESFFHTLAPSLRAAPRLVRARDGHFMDKPDNVISLINLATLRSLEEQWGYAIDKLRFRANVYIDGAPPWSEFDWIDHDVRIGEAVFRVDRRNGRCGATNVDPASGRRDLDIPGSLRRAFGHKDLGVYLVARNDAEIAVGDVMELPGQAAPRPAIAATVSPAAGGRSYICRGCYFVYHEAAQGVAFTELPKDWPCPDCGTHTGNFTERANG
jgi:GntR family transcriptional regulator/MocR family aminotransferase